MLAAIKTEQEFQQFVARYQGKLHGRIVLIDPIQPILARSWPGTHTLNESEVRLRQLKNPMVSQQSNKGRYPLSMAIARSKEILQADRSAWTDCIRISKAQSSSRPARDGLLRGPDGAGGHSAD